MINKYRVHEVAKDFDIKSNIVVDLLGKYFDGQKKHMTALEEDELDILFETFTKEHEVADLNEYFNFVKPEKKAKKEETAEEEPEQAPAVEEKKEEAAPVAKQEKKEQPAPAMAEKQEKKPEQKKAPEKKPEEKKEERKPAPANNVKPGNSKLPPMPAKQPVQQNNEKKKDKENKPMQSRTKGEMRTIDTRAGNVDLEKYNERYENIAPTNKTKQHENSTQKQKIKQKSQQYKKQGGMRSSKRETEAERLKRIAAERAKKPQMLLKLPEEITVGELAAMLKMTAAEVIKKLFTLGQMATVNEVLDYDTAAIVAEELGAKVEKEVDLGSHTMFIGEITDMEVLSEDASATYEYYLNNIKPKPQEVGKTESGQTVWRCTICGYEYVGEELPDDFICPLCKHPASDFEKVVK